MKIDAETMKKQVRGTGIDTHEPKYELICSIRFEESTVYGAKHRTY